MTSTAETKNEILRELGLEKIAPEQQEEILKKMSEVLLKRIFVEALENLDEEGRQSLLEILGGGGSVEEVEKFMNEKIPDYPKVFEAVRADFKRDFRESMAVAEAAE